MAATGKTKEMIVVNFKEIPEQICVETRFISKTAALQNKYQNVYYAHTKQGQVEFSPYDPLLAANTQSQNLRTIRTKTTNYVPLPKTLTFSPVGPNVNGAQSSTFNPPGSAGPSVTIKSLPVPLGLPPISIPQANSTLSMPGFAVPFSNAILTPPAFGNTSALNVKLNSKETSCNTDPKPVTIDREQQTIMSAGLVSSIGIQCCIEDEFSADDQMAMNAICNNNTTDNLFNEEAEKEAFLQYTRENSVEYKNHFRECLICGEVCKSFKYFYGHMAVHRGPKSLCYLCGQYLENESLLKSHNCVATERKNRALLRCPHNLCNVVAISRLELYDHINEHNNYRMHNCSACRKSFCTAQEFLRHLLLRAKCYTEAKRNHRRLYGLRARTERRCRVRVFTLHTYTRRTAMVKSLLSGRSLRKYLCELCLNTFRHKCIYHRHLKMCAAMMKKHYQLRRRKTKANHK